MCKTDSYSLFAVIYFGNAHFIARYIASNNVCYHNDGTDNGGVSVGVVVDSNELCFNNVLTDTRGNSKSASILWYVKD